VARPREFNEQEVLSRALSAFWARGYDATSVEHLVEATGLGRASLYGAFGDKEQLFRRVVSHYLDCSRSEKDRLTAGLSARHALEAFILSRIHVAASENPPGCFLQMAATSGTSPPLVQEALSATNQEMHGWFLQQLREAQAQGELAPDADLEALATFVGVFTAGLTASAKAGMPAEALTAAAKSALALVFKNPS
jgi:TetR/AcrR family transcriptional regulator, transcriptional repressor for nem operon